MVSSNIMVLAMLVSLTLIGLPPLEALSPMGAPMMSPGTQTAKPPTAAPDCLTALANVSDCLTFVQVGSNLTKPDKACCPEYAGLLESNPMCICGLIEQLDQYGVDLNRAFMINDACKLEVPSLDSCPAAPVSAPTPSSASEAPGSTAEFDELGEYYTSDSGKSTGNSNENRGDEVVEEIGEKVNDDDVVENLCRMSSLGDGFDDSNEKECLDGKNEEDAEKSNRKECPNETSNSGVKSYANVVTKDVMYVDNKLNFIPTEVTDKGCEVVIFDEALVNKGSNQWKLIVCGHFVGYKMSVHELRYNIKKMWSKWGIDDIDMLADGTCMFKFRNESGMNKIPLWVSMVNVPLEAWSTEGISALASSLGKPIIMDNMTAKSYLNCEKREKTAEEIVIEEKKKEELAKQRNRRNGDFNSLNNHMWNKKFDDRRQRSGEQVGCKLNNMEDDNEELEILKGRMIVDGFIRKNRQPNGIEIKGWTHDMVTYFRKQLEVNKLKEMEDLSMDTGDVLENNTSIAKRVNEAKMEGMDTTILN
ncbi:bifunctional inhibitor/plant lipid transfer protein/seed storage helical domain-containing protein [Tanacetum coccineum]|uniref:Bifunctional inhibitor/plant lipid transfer protein/seed storage helical domain-containing protein n=1 Tax=Tanacetum coccineum TaxID=301880 RepID=A0ABQ5ASG5_9ASTR